MQKANRKKELMNGFFRSRHGTRWILGDLLFGFCTFLLAIEFTPYADKIAGGSYGWAALGYAICVVLSSVSVGVPMAGKDHDAALYEIAVMSFMASSLAVMLFAMGSAFLFFTIFGRFILLFAALGTFICMTLFRWAVFFLHRRMPLRIFLVGATADQQQELTDLFAEKKGFDVVCTAAMQELSGAVSISLDDLDWLQKLAELDVDIVILCRESTLAPAQSAQLLELPLHGIDLFSYGSFMESFFKRVPVRYMSTQEVAAIRIFPGNNAIFLSKRMLDILIALIGLLLTLPLWVFAAIAIKLDSPGGAFFIQERDGVGDSTFNLIKFRTMRGRAAADTNDDHRITKIGLFLRRTRLDELPQLLNILKGDMSLVGPRPECSSYTNEYKQMIPYYAYRRLVKPGLTGWAQMRYKYSRTLREVEQKFQYDLYYIRHVSFRLDMCILLKTIPMLMKGSR